MKIAIVGAGWYGCHIAKSLLDVQADVTLFEKEEGIFQGASYNNQSRLHLGFHYPRCSYTRDESITSYNLFMGKYHGFTQHVTNNFYAIAEDKSLIDWMTYRDIMVAQGLSFLDVYPEDYGIENTSGAMLVGERVINQYKAREYFKKILWRNTKSGFIVDDIKCLTKEYDYVIDCTFGSFSTPEVEHFEPCVMLLYGGEQDKAVTIMDGPEGVSLYPYFEKDTMSLTCVKHTPLGRSSSMSEAHDLIRRFKTDNVSLQAVRRRIERDALIYMPWLLDQYTYKGFMTAVRVKPKSSTDRRSTIVDTEDKLITVFPGKVSGIFEAERLVFDRLYQEGIC